MIGGSYDGALLTKLAIGGVLGGIVGSGFAPKIPNRQLRFALAVSLSFYALSVRLLKVAPRLVFILQMHLKWLRKQQKAQLILSFS